jgi:hypothetical protein
MYEGYDEPIKILNNRSSSMQQNAGPSIDLQLRGGMEPRIACLSREGLLSLITTPVVNRGKATLK